MSYPIQMNYEPLYQLWPCMRRMPIEWSKPWDSWFLRVRKGRELRCTTFSIPENTDFGYRLYMEVATRQSFDVLGVSLRIHAISGIAERWVKQIPEKEQAIIQAALFRSRMGYWTMERFFAKYGPGLQNFSIASRGRFFCHSMTEAVGVPG